MLDQFKDLGTAIANGFKKVDPITASTRIAICESCPSGQFFALRQCKKCMCFMDVKTKLEGQQCPLGYWK